jgi:hypothetical protein
MNLVRLVALVKSLLDKGGTTSKSVHGEFDGLPSPGLSRCSGIGYTPVPGRTALPITDFTARMQDYE